MFRTNYTVNLNPRSDRDVGRDVTLGILYGIAALLFLTCAAMTVSAFIKSHRHPEQSGSLGGDRERNSQTRLQGFRRAVLDTYPLVLFRYQKETSNSGKPRTGQSFT